MNSNSACCDSARPQFNLQMLFTALTLSGMWLALAAITSVGSKIVLGVFGLTYLFGCWKTRRAVLSVLPAMYVPYVWLLADWQGWPWRDYHWYWIGMLWHLPGLPVESIMHPTSEFWFQTLTAVSTLLLFFFAVVMGRGSLKAALWTSLLVLLISVPSSAFCYVVYRL